MPGFLYTLEDSDRKAKDGIDPKGVNTSERKTDAPFE